MSTQKSHRGFPYFSMAVIPLGDKFFKKHRTGEAAMKSAIGHYRRTSGGAIAGKFSSGPVSSFGINTSDIKKVTGAISTANLLRQSDHGITVSCYYAYCKSEEKRIINSKSNTHDAAQAIADQHHITTGHFTTVETVWEN